MALSEIRHVGVVRGMDPESYLDIRSQMGVGAPTRGVNAPGVEPMTIAPPTATRSIDDKTTNDTTFRGFNFGNIDINITEMQDALKLPEAEDAHYSFERVAECIETVDRALQGTNWKMALGHVTHLCFSALLVTFIMAQRAHPDFPSLGEWGVIARMRNPFPSDQCIYENPHRKPGEPRWSADCFSDDTLLLGTGGDQKILYINSPDKKWTRLAMPVGEAIKKYITAQLDREDETSANANAYNEALWAETGKMISPEK